MSPRRFKIGEEAVKQWKIFPGKIQKTTFIVSQAVDSYKRLFVKKHI
jgi:hypothetical protein